MPDSGMSEVEAARLAHVVRESTDGEVIVERDAAFFVVVVRARTGLWTLYDEHDWLTWRAQVSGG